MNKNIIFVNTMHRILLKDSVIISGITTLVVTGSARLTSICVALLHSVTIDITDGLFRITLTGCAIVYTVFRILNEYKKFVSQRSISDKEEND